MPETGTLLLYSLFLSFSLSLSLRAATCGRTTPPTTACRFLPPGARGMRVVGLLDDSDADNTGVLDYADAVVAVPSV